MAEVKRGLAEGFDVMDMGEPYRYLGVKLIQNPQTVEVWIGKKILAEIWNGECQAN